jgi:mannose-6-phosphate isomerase-like protein (cupin superfamily)
MSVVKLREHHVVKDTPCGEIREILHGSDHPAVGVAVAVDIGPTLPHFHRTFDEVYFVMEGDLTLQLHDPETRRTWQEKLGENELCLISRGVHHRVVSASRRNRLCAICSPPFVPGDEARSDVLPSPPDDGRGAP